MEVPELRNGSFGSDRLDNILARVDAEERGARGRSSLGYVERQRTASMLDTLLLPHPDDDLSDGDGEASRLIGGSDYVRQNVHMAAWLLLLLLGYAAQRLSCTAGIPTDCLRTIDYYEFFSDITSLALYGLALGWFVGVTERSRFGWLFSKQNWWAFAVFVATPPIYSAVSDVDALKHSLSDLSPWPPGFIALWAVAGPALCYVIGWHIAAAWRRAGPSGFLAYVLPRATLLVWFAGSAVYLERSNSDIHVHLHHLYLGWALALWCDVNAALSVGALAVGCGIFVQGVGAYSFAPVFSSAGCFETPAATHVRCTFFAEAPFTVRVCPAGGEAPTHSCASADVFGV